MIAIVNITEESKRKPKGIHTYSLRINRLEICQFRHERDVSLATFLRAAAEAAAKAETERMLRICEAIKGGDP